MILQKFAVLFLIGALVELYLFVKVAVWIGFFPMVSLAVTTTMLGILLFRMQGVALWEQLGEAMTQGKLPATALLESGMGWISAFLLIIPGFFTDALGFMFMIPAVRRRLVRLFLSGGTTAPGAERSHNTGPRTIEGDFSREKDDS
jgi:UPF0716 protein FxsA